MRKIYLQMKTREEAASLWNAAFPGPGMLSAEKIPAARAAGRVLAGPAFARISSPPFHSAAMDGVAVRSEDTFGASQARPKTLVLGEEAFYVNTGHMLPPGTDAVVMMEHIRVEENRVEFDRAAYPWQHVRKVGEDMVATQMLFPTGHRVTPACVGALLSGGVNAVSVLERPRVLLIPTGNELVDPEGSDTDNPPRGRVIESNSAMLGAMVEEAGGEWVRHAIVPDDFSAIRGAVDAAVDQGFHLVVVLAGSSAGSEDHTANVIGDLGEVLVHGVTMMPGKPLILGRVRNVPVMGAPGYPVSALMAFEEFGVPLLFRMQGLGPPERPRISVTPTRKI
ncbi:MAG: molybdopterin biosynthesis protein, partial [Deltaproteobacteria bacterium]|nr:molybdopterin biosynthesis protein [Deltaproteobacteria bacterium]